MDTPPQANTHWGYFALLPLRKGRAQPTLVDPPITVLNTVDQDDRNHFPVRRHVLDRAGDVALLPADTNVVADARHHRPRVVTEMAARLAEQQHASRHPEGVGFGVGLGDAPKVGVGTGVAVGVPVGVGVGDGVGAGLGPQTMTGSGR